MDSVLAGPHSHARAVLALRAARAVRTKEIVEDVEADICACTEYFVMNDTREK